MREICTSGAGEPRGGRDGPGHAANAALVEEAAAAAHSLKVQVDVLREAIGEFSLPA
ncbi:hypothetical protein OKW35_003628 [Paraburkholderia sp. MM5477-R1]